MPASKEIAPLDMSEARASPPLYHRPAPIVSSRDFAAIKFDMVQRNVERNGSHRRVSASSMSARVGARLARMARVLKPKETRAALLRPAVEHELQRRARGRVRGLK